MNSLNLILQAKNDVGKTYIASILAEYFQAKGSEFHGYDADKSESSFAKFEDFKVEPVEVVDTDHHFKLEAFDKVWENLIAKNLDIILDAGVDAFEPIVHYFAKNGHDNLSAESINEVIVHTVIAGGDRLDDTINGLVTLFNKLPTNMKIVVWLNEYFGPIEVAGKPFEEFKIYENNQEKIHGIIKIRDQDSDFFKADLLKKNTLKMTFEEGIKSEEFYVLSKQRLKTIQLEIFEQLDLIFPSPKEIEFKQKAQEIAKIIDAKSQPQTTEKEIPTFGNILNEEAIAKFDEAIKATFEKHLDQLSSANALHFSEANRCAEIVVTQAAEYLTNQMRQAAEEIAASTSNMLATQIAEANKAARQAKTSRDVTIYIAIGVVVSGIIWRFTSL